MVEMNICKGWRFRGADFSTLVTGDGSETGSVTLVRSPEERKRWHQMPNELLEADDGPPLYVTGRGVTFEIALAEANALAESAKPIPDDEPLDENDWTKF